ncbi:MAG: hypothetical protein VB106_01595 [Clostridiaceae bacterium]|nr:hypothetical protein [Clostridiaceae bacterium]
MEKFTYKLVTLSSLIVSPRSNAAFYEELNDFTLQEIKNETIKAKLKVIYPFYQYGEYDAYAPETAEYYLPGASIKGALSQGSAVLDGFMVDDVSIHNDSIVLRNLYKAQYLEDEQKACFNIFFENVGVEMIKAAVKLTGEFYINGREKAEALLKEASISTKVKINQMLGYLRELEKREYSEELLCELHKADDNLSSLLDANDIFLFGGYKGLLHSMKFEGSPQEIASAVFLDLQTMLPHGLVKIGLI